MLWHQPMASSWNRAALSRHSLQPPIPQIISVKVALTVAVFVSTVCVCVCACAVVRAFALPEKGSVVGEAQQRQETGELHDAKHVALPGPKVAGELDSAQLGLLQELRGQQEHVDPRSRQTPYYLQYTTRTHDTTHDTHDTHDMRPPERVSRSSKQGHTVWRVSCAVLLCIGVMLLLQQPCAKNQPC